MKTESIQDFKKRVIMLLAVLSFIFHAFAPFIFQTASASAVNGYMVTVCTTYGQKTIFVNFDENSPQQKHSHCLECPHCIIQSNANGGMASYFFTLDPQIQALGKSLIAPTLSPPKTSLSRHFLSRAPPAYLHF